MTIDETPRREPGDAHDLTDWYIPGLTPEQQDALMTIRERVNGYLMNRDYKYEVDMAALQYRASKELQEALHAQALDYEQKLYNLHKALKKEGTDE